MANKTDLLHFLDKRVFHPILNASDRKLGTRQREELQFVKDHTEEEKARFHGYESAEKIVQMYKDDLHSENAKPINARLQDLKLPRLVDVKEDFLKLAGE